MKAFADLADRPEDERIAIIGKTATEHTVGFFVDDNEKADRYVAKLLKGWAVRVIERRENLLVKGTVFVKVGPRGH